MTAPEYRQLIEFLGQQFTRIDRRFEQVDQRFEQIDERFVVVDRRFVQLDERSRREVLERSVADLGHQLATLEARIDDIEQRLRR